MHYIRFLKTPRVQVDRGKVLLNASVAVVTDLGETYYPEDLELITTVRSPEDDGDIYLRRKIKYPAGARSVPISFNVSYQDLEWPACMHVEVKGSCAGGSRGQGVGNGFGFLPPIMDVWSSFLNPTRGQMDSGRRVERRFASSSERTVSLLEDARDSIARHLWDGSQALAQHIDQIISLQTPSTMPLLEYVLVSATYRKLHVLELGCGCGTVGIALAQSVPDCNVILTDLEEVTELVQANISRMRPAINSSASFEPLDWESDALPKKLLSRTTDLIIVSECTYNTDTLQPLVQTLVKLVARSPKAVIVVSTKTRHPSEAVFFEMMKKAGLVEDGSMRMSLPGVPGTGYADAATDVGLHCFHGSNHRLSLSPRGSEEEVATVQPARTSRRQRSQ